MFNLAPLVRIAPSREGGGFRLPTENCGVLEDVHGDFVGVFLRNCVGVVFVLETLLLFTGERTFETPTWGECALKPSRLCNGFGERGLRLDFDAVESVLDATLLVFFPEKNGKSLLLQVDAGLLF